MKQTFNKADVLRIIKDREIELTRRFHTKENALGRFDNKIGNEIKYLNTRWMKILSTAICSGTVVDGVRVKNPRKMIARMAKDIVNDGGRYGSYKDNWDVSKCKSIVAAKKAFDARKNALNAAYNKARSALKSLREEISLAGVPADIVRRLNAISTMMNA